MPLVHPQFRIRSVARAPTGPCYVVTFTDGASAAVDPSDAAALARLGVTAYLAAGNAVGPAPAAAPPSWGDVVAARDRLLTASDVRVLPDRWAAMTDAQRQAWTAYRQALRELPGDRTGDPAAVVFPAPPAG